MTIKTNGNLWVWNMAHYYIIRNKLLVFKYKILRKICGPVFESEQNIRRRRKNTELREIMEILLLTSYIKGQRLK
jgi:hypothetical protein